MSTRSRSLVAAVAAAGLLLAGCSTRTAGTPQVPTVAASAAGGAAAGPSTSDAGAPAIDTPSASSDSAPTEAAPTEAAPTEAAPTEAAPTEAAPTEAAPTEAAPTEAAPSEAAPSESTSPGSTDQQSDGAQSSDSTGAQSGGAAVDPQAFAKKLQAGMATVSSVTGSQSVKAAAFTAITKVRETVRAGKSTAIDLTGNPIYEPDNGFSLRSVGGKGYLASPVFISMMGEKAAGKTWALLNLKAQNVAVVNASDLLGPVLLLADVDVYLDVVQAARSISAKGAEKVGSIATTKYRADIDLSRLASVLPPELKQLPDATDAISAQSMTVTYWLDSQGRLVKVLLLNHDRIRDISYTLTVSAFNKPVTIQAPAAATVYTG